MASPKVPEKVWRHREQNPGAGFGQSSGPEGECGSLIKFSEWRDYGRFGLGDTPSFNIPVGENPGQWPRLPRPLDMEPTCELASTRLFSWTGANRQVSMDYWLDSSGPWSGQAWILHHPLRQLGRHPSGVPHGGLYSKSALHSWQASQVQRS